MDLSGKTVGELMTKEVFTAHSDRTWREIARKMSGKMIHHIVVVNDEHKPVGVVSSLDFVHRAMGGDSQAASADSKIGEHLTLGHLQTATANTPIKDAANLMSLHHIDCVVVIDDGNKLAGILTSRDIMEAALNLSPVGQ